MANDEIGVGSLVNNNQFRTFQEAHVGDGRVYALSNEEGSKGKFLRYTIIDVTADVLRDPLGRPMTDQSRGWRR